MYAISISVFFATSRWMLNDHWCVRGVLRLGSMTVLEAEAKASGFRKLVGDCVGGGRSGRLRRRPPACPKAWLIAGYAAPGRFGRIVEATTNILMRS